MADDEDYRAWLARNGVTDADSPKSFYDYRAAFKAGAKRDASGHLPSDFKKPGHPNEIVGGFNTRTGERVPGTAKASESELVRLGWDQETATRLSQQHEDGQTIAIDDVGDVTFPASMSDDQIVQVAKRLHLEAMNAKPLQAETDTNKAYNASIKETATETGKGVVRGIGQALDPRNLVGAAQMVGKMMQGRPVLSGAELESIGKNFRKVLAGDPAAGGEAIGTLAVGLVAPRVVPKIPQALDTTGSALEKMGRSRYGQYLSGAGAVEQLYVGKLGTAAAMAAAPPVAIGVGKGMQAAAKLMGVADAPKMVETIMNAPRAKIPLTPWESTFVLDIETKLAGGATLSLKQSSTLKRIYSRIAK